MSRVSLVIDPTGAVEEIVLPADDSLRALYKAIGCTNVDVVQLTNRIDMWLDGEGMGVAPVNRAATRLAQRFGLDFQPYFGRAVICGMNSWGDTVNLTEDRARAVRAHLEEIRAELNGS